ncbi:5'-nucleotidase [Nocardioides sp. BE266]|uniref:bifunctional metallophosphatase/5'-nucleotidase n=1 Tax=Nocardioides sp. BE266 TaxID=2817725 RepID=UPI00285BA64A|nr:bifunctional UDP-sugar hydrolase/5'-nucleotidase [Nocardioides sp. BE266]MDR7255216.1 5'-nucleotidase [Nocardioides sp. BE266]
MTGLLAAPLAVVTTAAPAHAAPVTIQVLATNDFHGRLINEDGTGGTSNGVTAGAAILSGAVKQLRAANPNTVFAAAGDMIGASTFESFIQHDKPTLDALNEAGLEVSAAGNHEFDAGYADLVNRVMKPEDAATNPEGGADWQYLAANVRKRSDNSYALPDVAASPGTSDGATWYKDFGSVRVGFVGAVTEDLPSLVSPAGIADVKISSIVQEVNAGAAALRADGADVVVMLVHEGAAKSDCANVSDDSTFGKVVKGVASNVNAIVSGHTHLAYNCTYNNVPVVSAGQYGMALNQLQFTVEDTTGAVTSVTSDIKYLKAQTTPYAANYPADANTTTMVNDAKAKADVLGAVELGKVAGGFSRAKLNNGTTENRGGESSLGNLVAEVQRWATQNPESGSAQIAFMNPGGLRQDMVGNPGGFPATLTYKQAAVVQPFANTLVNMKLTGAQIKTVLEQQWQTNPGGQAPSRPFLRLGTSKGFFATYDATKAAGNRVTGMYLNGKAIDPATSYSVTVNSFLASGGDNFRELANGTAKRDTGKVDLQAMVDYMAANAKTKPLPVDLAQHFVGVSWPATAPRFYRLGQKVELSLSSLAMTGATDAKDATLAVKAGDASLGSVAVNNANDDSVFDEIGKAAVSLKLKGKVRSGKQVLTFTGPTTGTTFSLPIDVRKAKGEVAARVKPKRIVMGKTRARVKIKASALGISAVTGKVVVKVGGKKYTVKLKKGKAVVKLAKFTKAGTKRVVVKYAGSRKVRSKTAVVKIKVHRR